MPFSWFERRVDPYPEAAPGPAPRGFFAFLWAGTEGMRPFILGMMLLTATIGAFEALLFAMLGKVVDWLAEVEPARLWVDEGGTLLLLAAFWHRARAAIVTGLPPALASRLPYLNRAAA